MLYLLWHKKIYYKYSTLYCALGFGNCNVMFGFLSFPPSLPPLGIAFLISCPNPCRVPHLETTVPGLWPQVVVVPSLRHWLGSVHYIHVHHCTTLVLLCYQAAVSLQMVCSREKGESTHLLHFTLVASKGLWPQVVVFPSLLHWLGIVYYIHVHHCTTLVLLFYPVSLHIVCSREKGESTHLLHSTLVASKSTVLALGQRLLLFYSHKMDKRNSTRRWIFCG